MSLSSSRFGGSVGSALVLVCLGGCGEAPEPTPPVADLGRVCEPEGSPDLVFATDIGWRVFRPRPEFPDDFLDDGVESSLRIFGDCRYQVLHVGDDGVGAWHDVAVGTLDEATAATWLEDVGAAEWDEEDPGASQGVTVWSPDYGTWTCSSTVCTDGRTEAWMSFLTGRIPELYDEATPVAARAEVAFATVGPREALFVPAEDYPEVPWGDWIPSTLPPVPGFYPEVVELPDELLPTFISLRDAFVDAVEVPEGDYLWSSPALIYEGTEYSMFIRTYPSDEPTLVEPIPWQ